MRWAGAGASLKIKIKDKNKDENDKYAVAGVGHTGGQQGTSTAIVIAPDQRAGVVVLTNMEGLDPGALARQILNILAAPALKP